MSQWAEIRHMSLVDGIPRREIARRLDLDIKTVRRALRADAAPPRRVATPRPRGLDPHRTQVETWLLEDPRLTAKRIGKLLRPHAGRVPARTVRVFVASVRAALFPREAFVHRTHAPGDTMEADFGETLAVVGGRLRRVHFLVATLPSCNAYFARAYPAERLECLLDGLACAFRHFGGVPRRVVLDNTSLAVKRVLPGTDRDETEAFHGFRGGYPFHADFCAPGKGWEKGSVEGGVAFVRDNVFRPMPEVASFADLDAAILREIAEDEAERRLPDGRTVAQARAAEREHLRPLPAHEPESCRVLSRVADKFGHVRADHAHYSVPIAHAYRPVTVRLFADRVELASGAERLSRHDRSFEKGAKVLDAGHVLDLLEKKHRAVAESTAIRQWRLPPVFHELRRELARRTRKPDREWVTILKLLDAHPAEAVEAAVREAIDKGSPRRETVLALLRGRSAPESVAVGPAAVSRPELAALEVAAPELGAYDALAGGAR